VVVAIKPVAAFYLLPTRAWELLIGSVSSMCGDRGSLRVPRWLLGVSLLLLLLLPAVRLDPVHPRLDAMLVTLCTALLLVGRLDLINRGRVMNGLARIGDWSYSLYLVHWPLISFASIAYVGPKLPPPISALLVALALVLAYLQYRFVEEPFRRASAPSRKVIAGVVSGSFAAVLVSLGYAYRANVDTQSHDYAYAARANVGLSQSCDYSAVFVEKPSCMTSHAPEMAVWGDSYAMHLVAGLVNSPGASLVQMTRSACGPVLGLAIVARDPALEYNRKWAESCIEFNHSVYDYLSKHASVRYVVMSSSFPFLDDAYATLDGSDIARATEEQLLQRFTETIDRIRSLGKKVVIVAPPPSPVAARFNIGRCVERLETRKVVLGRRRCDFDEREWTLGGAPVISFLKKLEKRADVVVLWPRDALCADGVCRASIDGKMMYRDEGHLSYEGSIEFARRFALHDNIVRLAR
jgi:hypothetical protein